MAQVRRRAPNSYTISVYLGREGGKRKYHYETFYGTQSQAKYRAAELEVEYRNPSGPRGSSMGLDKYLEYWLTQIEGTVTDRSFGVYKWHVVRLVPCVSGLQLYSVTAGDLQSCLRNLPDHLSVRTKRDMYSTLGTALGQAVHWGMLRSKPTFGLKKPKMPHRERRVLNHDEHTRLMEVGRDLKHYLLVRMLLATAARLGEAWALQWQDIDFENGTVTIRRAADPHGFLKGVKTASGVRTLELDWETVRLLSLHRTQQEERSESISETSFVFRADKSGAVSQNVVRLCLIKMLKRASIPHISIHGIRHSVGSLWLDQGQSLAEVSMKLGHSSPAFTATVYIHVVRKFTNRSRETDKVADSVAKPYANEGFTS